MARHGRPVLGAGALLCGILHTLANCRRVNLCGVRVRRRRLNAFATLPVACNNCQSGRQLLRCLLLAPPDALMLPPSATINKLNGNLMYDAGDTAQDDRFAAAFNHSNHFNHSFIPSICPFVHSSISFALIDTKWSRLYLLSLLSLVYADFYF